MEHLSAAAQNRSGLKITFALTSTYFVVEVIGGILTGSLALLADAAHMLTDVVGLGLALFAIWMAQKPATAEKTYGYYRVEILAALANAVILFSISFYILYEAYRRFQQPPEVASLPMLAVAVIGLGINLIGLFVLREGAKGSLNVKGAFLEVVSDALGSVGVIIAAMAGVGIVTNSRLSTQAETVYAEYTVPLTEFNQLLFNVNRYHEALLDVARTTRATDFEIELKDIAPYRGEVERLIASYEKTTMRTSSSICGLPTEPIFASASSGHATKAVGPVSVMP